ncbi:ATP-binding protein [Streptomyces sp. NBC_00401]|uniref:ATP-binding protein n=1 Tax=Streptomyces sp. NBC_00401 TaxID=2975738 RepID=UPI00224E2692|nr:ATP-binding protein [Streptomyces sp. NBC_00401]MCX5081963.1 ATP-binding protein [Streptomyces sp. NBC_00401]
MPEVNAQGGVIHSDKLSYTAYPRSVSLARRRAARLVEEWGHGDQAGAVALLVSELATNALLHGCFRGRLFQVELSLTGSALRISVSDPRGEVLPEPRAATESEQFGRGLLIVQELASDWGVEGRNVGKTVWCEVRVG